MSGRVKITMCNSAGPLDDPMYADEGEDARDALVEMVQCLAGLNAGDTFKVEEAPNREEA